MAEREIPRKDKLAYYLLKSVNKAIRDYEMISDGDRIAVAVSGGKDSLTLLHLLRLRQKSVPQAYELTAIHVHMQTPDATPCSEPDVRNALVRHFQELEQAYALEVVEADQEPDCSRCSRERRKAILLAAQRLSCNKVAFGHHADDAAQTTLLNLFFHGRAETVSPTRRFGANLQVIRPMIYVPEKRIVPFAKACGLPVTSACCPRSQTTRRTLVKQLIRELEREYPRVKINLFRAGLSCALERRGDPS